MSKVAVITGCSSGVGLHLAVILAQNEYKVYATMRDTKKDKELREHAAKNNVQEKITVAELDVTSDVSVKTCFDGIINKEGRIDFLVNNAGYSASGGLEQLSVLDCQNQLDTNVLGVVRCCKEVLPVMRRQKSGRIIGVSSVGGITGSPFSDIYCASKFALEGLFESMAPVYMNFGIEMILVEPGAIVTKFVENALKSSSTNLAVDSELVELRNKALGVLMNRFKDSSLGQTGEEVAAFIKTVMEDPQPKFRNLTNPVYAFMLQKLTDPTGNILRQEIFDRFFS